MDILVELTKIANKNINFQCDDDNSCSRGRIFAAIARLEAAGHQLEAERKITLFGQVFIKLVMDILVELQHGVFVCSTTATATATQQQQ